MREETRERCECARAPWTAAACCRFVVGAACCVWRGLAWLLRPAVRASSDVRRAAGLPSQKRQHAAAVQGGLRRLCRAALCVPVALGALLWIAWLLVPKPEMLPPGAEFSRVVPD